MTEEEFLKSTPKKLFALADIHLQMNSPVETNNKSQVVEEKFIDELNL